MSMASAAKAFALRTALSQAGYRWRACTPDGEIVSFETVSESGINWLIIEHPEATETGIWLDGVFTIVDAVPLTPEQAEARRLAEEEAAKQALIDAEIARQEAIIEAGRAQERERKEAKRRALGRPTREQWLAASKPWEGSGMSRSGWYRAQRKPFSNDE